jgi:formyl-CoA transferase
VTGPLDGIKVVEFSQFLSASYAGLNLADMGADIIKVEPITGDPYREYAPYIDRESRVYMACNRGKRGIVVDLHDEEIRQAIYWLVEDADVVITNLRRSYLEEAGYGYEALRERNNNIIYAEASGFGSRGPLASQGAMDNIGQAYSGLMARNDIRVGRPLGPTFNVLDQVTGLMMALGVVGALHHRAKTGDGQFIETSLLGSALALQTEFLFEALAFDGEAREATLNMLEDARKSGTSYADIITTYRATHPAIRGNYFYRSYDTKSGRIEVACLSRALRSRFCQVVGIEDPRLAPGSEISDWEWAAEDADKLVEKFEAEMLSKTANEWEEILSKAKVPASRVRMHEELWEDPQVLANGYSIELDHPVVGPIRTFAPAWKFEKTAAEVRRPAPAFAQHTREVLSEAGLSEEQIDTLLRRGVAKVSEEL